MTDSLSVIIPNYNKEKYIEKCIQSVLEQSLLPDEIIVVDDCSEDNSPQIAEVIAEKNDILRVIRLQRNGGVSHARNIGLKAAKSEFVTFLDADDYYGNPDKLKQEMTLIREMGKDVIAYSKVRFVRNDGLPEPMRLYKDKEYPVNHIFRRMLTGHFCFPVCPRDYCVKKNNLLEVGGYNENRSLYEDLELVIKLAQKYSFACTLEWGTSYRQMQGGLSDKDKEIHEKAREEIFREFADKVPLVKKVIYCILWQEKKQRDKWNVFFWKCADKVIDGLHLRRKL